MNDSLEKTAIGVVITVAAIIVAVFGVGIWAFVQLVMWITSK